MPNIQPNWTRKTNYKTRGRP